jgi:transglutaminase-like putative cysteine protease
MTRPRSIIVGAEGALLAVTLAAVLGMSRLFDGGGWLGPLALNAVAAHVVMAAARRRGLSLPLVAVIAAVGAAVVVSWGSYWSTTVMGLPTGATWTAMQDDLSQAWTLYQDVVAPAPVETGFVLASSVALWFIAYVADWAAFRLWVPFEATLPAGTLFLFTALLGAPRGRGWAVGLFALAVIGFLLVHRMARQDEGSHWVADRRVEGHRSLLIAGAGLGVVAVIAGSVLGPSLPGADSEGVIDPRSLREGEQARQTISPLVDIRSRLVDQSDVEVFRVRSPEPSYWRLTSLDRFDGRIWSSSGTFDDADGSLPEAIPTDVASETFEQTFSVKALAAIWLPSAYEPRSFESKSLHALYEEDSATLIVDRAVKSSDGLVYSVTSASPRITAADLEGSAGAVPAEIRDRFLDLPGDFSPDVRQLATSLTEGAGSPYEAALALQNYLRTFTYDLTVQSGHSDDVLQDFLFNTQRGYCEQFAGSFAAMARSIGLPARVAVGFTFGETDPADPTLYHVRGEHAHAWPEVFLAGAGWVSFEPTPGRGMPFAEDYTGVPVSQATTNDPGTATTAPPTTAPQTLPTLPDGSSEPRIRDDELDTGAGRGGTDDGGTTSSFPVRYLVEPARTAAPFVLGAVVAYLVLVPLALLLRRRRRRRHALTPEARIAVAWSEAAEQAELVGYRADISDTLDERARRLADCLPEGEAVAAARQLSRQMELATYSAAGADDLAAELAEESGAVLVATARGAASRRTRALSWFDPRPAWRRWRRDRLAHRRITTTVRADLEAERELTGSGDRR